ncbi:3'-N-debenzoyl-2'-deoxytaxol N-benzoyltransferase, putative [Ricinus communis]|uniref:3'-N-debenzoyl-2'-deoxytaxol N-benzoyltransferase, putative n=1 Tax=Ricinus communis TaxID=3988 RepID=B9T663_RICCO|nr:3'-N-debenzoyl-2'-deoxytaxol N-benzoyltransferase, putative [Ricinus communis]|eukprot:XP_002533732.1 vinorine synthase [Ricinus communis]
MAMKVEIISREMIKPSSPTPAHLKHFKICLLDELAPPSYVPIFLLYSSAEFGNCFADKLKKSLSDTLARYYPFSGKLKGNLSVDCNDDGALFLEAKVNIAASEIVRDPETSMLYKLFPFDPYRGTADGATVDGETLITGVQVNVFECGGVGIGVCVSHKIADGATMASFLNAWAATATGIDQTAAPSLDSALLFPPKGVDIIKQRDMIRDEKIVTRRFEFEGKNLANLKANIANDISPTRVEAVTTLIWKAAMEVTRLNTGKDLIPPSIVTHLVNIRDRMNPPLPRHSVGNLWRLSLAPYVDVKKELELQELVRILRKSIRGIDSEYLTKLQGDDGLAKALEPLKELRQLALRGEGVEVYTFSSWARFPLYEINFGWGMPIKVCTITVPVRNSVILMGTKSGDGIEAWVTLTEKDMAKFECSQELLQFVSARI